MKKIKVALVGFGNVGCMALDALTLEPDMEVAGIVEPQNLQKIRQSLNPQKCCKFGETQVVKSIKELDDVDVALVCAPSRKVKEVVTNV